MAFTPTDPTKAEVRVVGTAPNQQLDFYIPRGPKGDPGGFTSGTVLGTANLNDIKLPGLYRQTSSANATAQNNYPRAGNLGLMTVMEATPGYIIQTYEAITGLTAGATVMYKRACYGTTWTVWKAYSANRTDETAGRAMYMWDEANYREQLIWGDTGSRIITDLVDATKFTVAVAKIRRVTSQVEVRFSLTPLAGVSGSVQILTALPTGFRNQHTFNGLGVDNANLPLQYSIAYAGGTFVANGITANRGFSINASFQTYDPWPTTLPGTADGIISNS